MKPPTYKTLADFLVMTPLNVDVVRDDGWGERFPVKGALIDATILFADITGFSKKTASFSPIETLLFVNTYMAWMAAEGVKGGHGIIDKYIGDSLMVVFSKEFGSEDPFREALQAAARMAKYDVHGFGPHLGLASGRVVVAHTGTSWANNVSVFGRAVSLAARCAGQPSFVHNDAYVVTFPAEDFGNLTIDEAVPPEEGKARSWNLDEVRRVELKNMGTIPLRQIYLRGMWLSAPIEEKIKVIYQQMRNDGLVKV